MRVLLCGLFLALGLTFATAQDKPDDLVKAAITAAGGAETLSKYPAGRVSGKGVMTVGGNETPFLFEHVYHVPGRFRTQINSVSQNQQWELIQVVDGATAKQKINGRVVPLTEAGVRDLQLAVLLNEIAQLTPLTLDRRFSLKPDKQLKGPDAAGLLVQVRGYPEVRLAFDRRTGHMVRIAHKSVDPETGKEADLETTFSDFKELSGLAKPLRSVVSRDGKKVADLVIQKFTLLEKVDPTAFALED